MKFYVYVIFRPNGIPCYVGKGQGRRWKSHFTQACCNDHLKRIVAIHGKTLPVVIVRNGLSNKEALETEIAFIAAIGRDIDGGPLVNYTRGGDGANGYLHTEDRKEKIRKALTAKPKSETHRLNLSAARSGFQYTAEQRAALSDGHKRQWADPIKRKALSDGMKGIPKSEETKARMKASRALRAPVSEETKAKMRASAARRAADPLDAKRRSVASLKGYAKRAVSITLGDQEGFA